MDMAQMQNMALSADMLELYCSTVGLTERPEPTVALKLSSSLSYPLDKRHQILFGVYIQLFPKPLHGFVNGTYRYIGNF